VIAYYYHNIEKKNIAVLPAGRQRIGRRGAMSCAWLKLVRLGGRVEISLSLQHTIPLQVVDYQYLVGIDDRAG